MSQHDKALRAIYFSIIRNNNQTVKRGLFGEYTTLVGMGVDFLLESIAVAENNNFAEWSMQEWDKAELANVTIKETVTWLMDTRARARAYENALHEAQMEDDYLDTTEWFLAGTGRI